MISEDYKTFNQFDMTSNEGKLLLAALSILTSITPDQIKEGEYGGMNHPDIVTEKVWRIANYIFHEDDFKKFEESERVSKLRDTKIMDILDEPNIS